MFEQGHDSLTIGSCCLKEFKRTYDKEYYNILFPNMYDILLDKKLTELKMQANILSDLIRVVGAIT